MAVADEIVVNISIRPWWRRVARLPWLFGRHYRTLRRSGTGLLLSAYGSWILVGVVVSMPGRKQ